MSKKKEFSLATGRRDRFISGIMSGRLKTEFWLQDKDDYEQFILIADIQALTDNYDNPQKIKG